jgi:UDP-N-acetylglucosamine 2-epimerase (non-hydrolysing)
LRFPCDICVVVGDVNSTMACAISAKKLNIRVAHVEAGIRSGDMSMPEEINRLITDSISDYFFTTTLSASYNLVKQGCNEKNIYFVGNTMIDTLYRKRQFFRKPVFWSEYNLESGKYLVLTLHRPSNVDDLEQLKLLLDTILDNINNLSIVFPVHPRTLRNMEGLGVTSQKLFCVDPLGYLEFNFLVENSFAVITDSGGITEETTVMNIPCITLRNSTERPETVSIGTNVLVGSDVRAIKKALTTLFEGKWKRGSIPEKWDGNTAARILEIIQKIVNEYTEKKN